VVVPPDIVRLARSDDAPLPPVPADAWEPVSEVADASLDED
jgi:hypothetical protein